MSPPLRPLDQHYVITGASSGIGRAIALRLASEGARLSLLARREDLLEAVAGDAVEAGSELVQVAACDVSDRASVQQAMAEIADAQGPIRGLVAAAGIGGPNDPGPDDRFEALIQTNLLGTYWTLRAAQAHMAPGPETRHMVVISSILGRMGVAGYTGYCASKTALLGLVRALALEVARDNIAVNAVCPGWVATEMAWQGIDGIAAAIGGTREDGLAIAMKAVPLRRMSEPEDIAGLVAWLLSADARGVTGATLDMNNGAWMS